LKSKNMKEKIDDEKEKNDEEKEKIIP